MADKPSTRSALFGPAPADLVDLAPAEAAEEVEDVDPSRAFACLRGQRDRAAVVELRALDPRAADVALEYSLRRRTEWHRAAGAVVLEFVDGTRATLRGVGLFELKERLLKRMVTWVQEQGSDPVAMKAAERDARSRGAPFVWVTQIVIERGEEERGD